MHSLGDNCCSEDALVDTATLRSHADTPAATRIPTVRQYLGARFVGTAACFSKPWGILFLAPGVAYLSKVEVDGIARTSG